MKKLNFWLLAGLFVSAFAMTSCGSDDDDNTVPPTPEGSTTNPSAITKENLKGEWNSNGMEMNQGVSLTFEGDQVTFKQNDQVGYQGAYTIKDGVASFSIEDKNNNTKVTYQTVSSLVGGNSVLVVKQIVSTPDYNEEYLAFALVKKGMTITTTKNEIQGQWIAYEGEGQDKWPWLSYKFEGDNLELIVGPWSLKCTGNYSYTNGILHFKPTAYYRAQGNIDPNTLEANWQPSDDSYEFEGLLLMATDEAYSFVVRPGILQKKK